MKTRVLHINTLIILLLVVSTIRCVALKNEGSLIVRQKQLMERNDSLFLTMDIIFSGRIIASAYGLKLVPVLKSGNKSVDLPYVLINGKQRAAYYAREKALLPYGSNKLDGLYASITSRGDNEQSQIIRYSVIVPYQPWMKDASLLLRQLQVDCCTETLLPYDLSGADIKVQPKKTAVAADTSAKRKASTEPVKTLTKSTSAYINYPQGRSDVVPDFESNAVELQKVRDILLPVLSNRQYTLEKVVITGYASPEGSYLSNEQLSRTRVYYFREYLKNTYNLQSGLFSLFHQAEDWDKLIDLIGANPVPEKARVLEAIRRTQAPDEREEMLKGLSGGVPYRFIYRNLYPQLRRIDVTIHYTVKSL